VKNYERTFYSMLGRRHRLGKEARERFWNQIARCLACGSDGACFTTVGRGFDDHRKHLIGRLKIKKRRGWLAHRARSPALIYRMGLLSILVPAKPFLI
jgi:hypothetical protein